jgi:lipoprotein-anchoring transpeptidase ErfK/SrfK
MSRPVVLAILFLAIGAAAVAAAFAAVSRARVQHRTPPATTLGRRVPAVAPPASTVTGVPATPPAQISAPSFQIADVRAGRSIVLRSKPAGRILARVGSSTEFGSRTTLSVAAARGGWLGVTSALLANGTIGWVKASSGLEMHRTRISIRVDLSKRRLELRQGDKTLRSFSVAIGRSGSPTPTGRFAVTDKLSGSQYGPYYGCCILALSGHQPHPPPGWQGGNRLAIHGTDSQGTIGTPASAGCLRAADSNLRVLMRRVPVGTPVVIRR